MTTPAGTFANALHVREQRGSGYVRDVWYAPGVGMVKMDDGTSAAVLTGYSIPGAVAQPGGGTAPLAFTPATGLWWNPNESGSGYNIQVQHGVLVATMYSYTPRGPGLVPRRGAADQCGRWRRGNGNARQIPRRAVCRLHVPDAVAHGQRRRDYVHVHILHDRERQVARRPRHPDSAGGVVSVRHARATTRARRAAHAFALRDDQ